MLLTLMFLLHLNLSIAASAQEQENITVVFTQEMSLRGLAEEHLGNPNEWEALLHYNGFESLADLRPDTTLTIPIALFQRTMQFLRQAAETARLANMEGAAYWRQVISTKPIISTIAP